MLREEINGKLQELIDLMQKQETNNNYSTRTEQVLHPYDYSCMIGDLVHMQKNIIDYMEGV